MPGGCPMLASFDLNAFQCIQHFEEMLVFLNALSSSSVLLSKLQLAAKMVILVAIPVLFLITFSHPQAKGTINSSPLTNFSFRV